jgi:hypothetical protein
LLLIELERHGHGYSRIRDQFDLRTMSVAEWERVQTKNIPPNPATE